MSKDNRSRLRSSAAADVCWFFRHSAAAMGFRAGRCEIDAPTRICLPLPLPIPAEAMKICRRCLWQIPEKLCPKLCPKCGRRRWGTIWPHPEPKMHVKASKRGASASTTEMPESVRQAVVKERRIRRGLEKLPPKLYRTLELAYEAHQHGPEIRGVLGDFSDLAMRLPRCRKAYEKYLVDPEGDGLSMEVWLTRWCRVRGKADSALMRIRDETEEAISAALEAYQRVRIPPSSHEEPSLPKRQPRRTVPFLANEERV
ncbi:MAG: hypothetical protein WC551_07520 [Patescibacteria group bacterium]